MMSSVNEYVYPLPECYCEIAVIAMTMALLDLVQEDPLHGEQSIKNRVWHHCENALRKYRERDLTNDYPGYVCLFHAWYTLLYQYKDQGITVPINYIWGIAHKKTSEEAKQSEVKRFCTSTFFPQQCDTKPLTAIYRNIVIMSHKTKDGYYASFVINLAVHRSMIFPEPDHAIQLAQQMIDDLMNENRYK